MIRFVPQLNREKDVRIQNISVATSRFGGFESDSDLWLMQFDLDLQGHHDQIVQGIADLGEAKAGQGQAETGRFANRRRASRLMLERAQSGDNPWFDGCSMKTGGVRGYN